MVDTSVFECGLCSIPYDEVTHKPLSLPCGHVFCQDCIAKQYKGEGVVCPIDKIKHPTSPFSLPTCFAILSNLPHKKQNRELCCQQHPRRKVKFYCKPHKKLLCSECIIQHTGTGHSVTTFQANLALLKQQLEDLEQECSGKHQEVRQSYFNIETQQKVLKKFYQSQIFKVNAAFQSASRLLEQKKKQANNIVKKFMAEQVRKIQISKQRTKKSLADREELNNRVLGLKEYFDKMLYDQYFALLGPMKQQITATQEVGKPFDLEFWGFEEPVQIVSGSPVKNIQEEENLKALIRKNSEKTRMKLRINIPTEVEESPIVSITSRGLKGMTLEQEFTASEYKPEMKPKKVARPRVHNRRPVNRKLNKSV